MSSTSTTSNMAVIGPPQLPPPLSAFIEGIRPAMIILLFSAVWLGIAIPLPLVLFYTSSSSLRKSGIFITNMIGITVGIVLGVLRVVIETDGILNPLVLQNPQQILVYSAFTGLIGIFVDSILLFRVSVVYPKNTTPTRRWLAIMVPLIVIKVARIVNFIIFMCQLGAKIKVPGLIVGSLNSITNTTSGPKIEWLLQLVDNAICSCLFLWVLRRSGNATARSSSWIGSGKSSKYSYHKAIGTLFWIATTNMVFPCIFDIVMLVLLFRDPDMVPLLIVLLFSSYIQIIGVLMATVWRGSREQKMVEEAAAAAPLDMPIQFARDSGIERKNQLEEMESGVETTESINTINGNSNPSRVEHFNTAFV